MLIQYDTAVSGEHEIIIQKSRFISHFKSVTTEDEAKEFIDEIKKKHREATHNCSAYIIGETDNIQKANDDGEPTGTAGVPMLEVLKKKGIKDTVVVVTRYFGGIKLGAGGLIRAYGKGVSEGFKEIGVLRKTLMTQISISVDYTFVGKIENDIRKTNFKVQDTNYLEKVTFEIYVLKEEVDLFKNWIIELTNNQVDIVEGELLYHDEIVKE